MHLENPKAMSFPDGVFPVASMRSGNMKVSFMHFGFYFKPASGEFLALFSAIRDFSHPKCPALPLALG